MKKNYLLLTLFIYLFIGCSKSEIIDSNDTITDNNEIVATNIINNNDFTSTYVNFIILKHLSLVNDKYVLNLSQSNAASLGIPNSIYDKMTNNVMEANTIKNFYDIQNLSINDNTPMTKATVDELNSISSKTVKEIAEWIIANISWDVIKHILSGGPMPMDYKSALIVALVMNPAVQPILKLYYGIE